MKDRFTRVLKGMIAMSRVRFPKGTCGSQIDVLARQPLWWRASITITAPATASAAICRCMKAPRASTRPTGRRSSPA